MTVTSKTPSGNLTPLFSQTGKKHRIVMNAQENVRFCFIELCH